LLWVACERVQFLNKRNVAITMLKSKSTGF
jgi:hypothetical protein